MKIGSGYDVHKLVEGRKLILGGVEIDFDKGLLGHSDADVLIHAIMDALLGAAGMGDIGKHFPDNDNSYKDISSMELLYQVLYLLKKQNYSIINIDATIIAQKPKLSNYMDAMKKNIATVLEINENQINIKATTEEGLGFTGAGLGIAANAVCLIEEIL
ncbi:2-C-methyl-D-erythritol 2,4-cyclodiphosphate synthase [Lachnospiraceae bacterium 46-61]